MDESGADLTRSANALLLGVALASGSIGAVTEEAGHQGSEVADQPTVHGEFIIAASLSTAAAAGLTVVGEAGFGWTLVHEVTAIGDVITSRSAATSKRTKQLRDFGETTEVSDMGKRNV